MSSINDTLMLNKDSSIINIKNSFNQVINEIGNTSLHNLLSNAKLKYFISNSTTPYGWNLNEDTGTIAIDVDTPPYSIINFTNPNSSVDQSVYQNITDVLEPNTKYTLTFEVESDNDCQFEITNNNGIIFISNDSALTFIPSNSINSYKNFFVFKTSNTYANVVFSIKNIFDGDNSIKIKKMSLIKGGLEFLEGDDRSFFIELVRYNHDPVLDLPGVYSWKQTDDGVNWYKFAGTTSTAQDILANLLTVDGSGCGLDADMVDSFHASAIPDAENILPAITKSGFNLAEMSPLVEELTGFGMIFPHDMYVGCMKYNNSLGWRLYFKNGNHFVSLDTNGNLYKDDQFIFYNASNLPSTGGGTSTNADTVDTFHASQTPTANTIPVLNADGNLALGASGNEVIAYNPTQTSVVLGSLTNYNMFHGMKMVVGNFINFGPGGTITKRLQSDTASYIHIGDSSNQISYYVSPAGSTNFTQYTVYHSGNLPQQQGYTLQAATTNTLGGVIVGNGLSVVTTPGSTQGTISVNFAGVNADTVDTYHASLTPGANTIPVLDANGDLKLASEVVIKSGSGYKTFGFKDTSMTGVIGQQVNLGSSCYYEGSWNKTSTSNLSTRLEIGTAQDLINLYYSAPGSGSWSSANEIWASNRWISQSSKSIGPSYQFSTSSYQKLPSGLIIQWGEGNALTTEGSLRVPFVITFPNAAIHVSITTKHIVQVSADAWFQLNSFDSSGFDCYLQLATANNGNNYTPHYFAIGY